MVRSIREAVEIEKNKDFNKPIEIYEIFLDEITLQLAMYPYDLTYKGETYSAAAISRSGISTSVEVLSDRVNVKIDNVSKAMSAYLAYHEFRGKRIIIYEAFLDSEGDIIENAINLFTGYVSGVTVDEYTAELNVIGSLDIRVPEVPRRKYSRDCPWEFGGGECGIVISEPAGTWLSGTVNSVGDDMVTIYLSEIDGHPDHKWAYGYITVEGESRFVIDSGTDNVGGYVKVDFPFLADPAGESFEMIAGCDKSYGVKDQQQVEYNHGCSYWGNTHRFGGFLSVPEERGRKV